MILLEANHHRLGASDDRAGLTIQCCLGRNGMVGVHKVDKGEGLAGEDAHTLQRPKAREQGLHGTPVGLQGDVAQPQVPAEGQTEQLHGRQQLCASGQRTHPNHTTDTGMALATWHSHLAWASVTCCAEVPK